MARTRQPALFANSPPPVPAEAVAFAHVVFNPLDQPYTYSVPEELADKVIPGKRVAAPLGKGNRSAIGYCVETTVEQPSRAVKPVTRVVDDEPLLTPALLRLTRWMADYYLCPWGQVLDAIVPAGVKAQAGTALRTFLQAVAESELPETLAKLGPKQARALDVLRQRAQPVEPRKLAQLAGCTPAVLRELVRKGYARESTQRFDRYQPQVEPADPQEPFTLNSDQLRAQSVIEQALTNGGFHAFLLHGVTGSGKTEIYLQAIQQVVAQDKQALVLVPEISLTPQTIERFRGRFPRVAVLHSHLSDAERGWHWRQIVSGDIQVIVGARSAVFAPARRLGLIVVDEEHETSFKQESTPRYHGRDVAVMRARLEGIPVVLGSATPSLESWHNAQRGRYSLLNLPARVLDRPLPQVGLIDLRYEPASRGRLRAISPTLERAMKHALDQSGQVILLLNRRGFDTFLQCPACGYVVKCKFCDVALTHHRHKDVVMCHYCGYEQEPPERCPECGLAQIRYAGLGTEKLEAEIVKKFPNIPAQRMDSDSMKRRGSHAKALEAFRRGDVKILFGTQMIAKGLDFPNVTLVGVVSADTALYLPDFRSAERTFQLLAQVAGRTGRGPTGGHVLIQSFNPEHPCISLAALHDYAKFADLELRYRKEHAYPPYSRMARVILRSRDQEAARSFADELAETFKTALQTTIDNSRPASSGNGHPGVLRLLGPAEVPIFKLKGYYRYHFQIQASRSADLHQVLKHVLASTKPSKGVDWTVDVDPLSML